MTTPDAPQSPRDDHASGGPTPTDPREGPPSGDTSSAPDDAPPPRGDASSHEEPPSSSTHDAPPLQDPPPPHEPPPPPGGPGPVPPPPYRRRTLDRRSANRVVAGVAGGLGDYFNVDPAIFRLGFIVLAMFGGSGFLLYLVGWLFLPERDTGRSLGEGLVRRLGGGRSAGGLILLFVALLVVADTVGGGGGLIWAALLIGIGVLLFRQADESDDDPPPSGPGDRSTPSTWSQAPQAPPPAAPSSASREAIAAPPRMQSSTAPPDADPYLPPPPPVSDDGWRPTPYTPGDLPAPPSVLGRVTVAAALILVGATALLDTLTGVDVALASYVALALAVIGAGLLVGARWGRARGLIPLGVVAVVVLTVTSIVSQLPTDSIVGGIGQRIYRPETVAEVEDTYRLGLGEMQIDLTRLELEPGEDIAVDATMSIGSLQVQVPDDVGVEGQASTALGEIDALDHTGEGTNPRVTLSEPGEEGSATITLDLSTTIGEIVVERAAAEPSTIEQSAEVN